MYAEDEENLPKVRIGFPVYNGEKQIKTALDSLIAQTFTNFELIISDNASTDKTGTICQEYAKKDKRIRYIRQETNMGIVWNFNFVLQEANTEFFMWASADDVWHHEFIQRNFKFLEKNTDFIASIGEVEFFYEPWKEKNFESFKNLKSDKKYQLVHPIKGNYEDKVKFVFDFGKSECTYAIFRTEYLKKSMIKKRFASWEYPIILKILKYGNLNVEDGVLMYKYMGGKTDPNYYTKLFSTMKKQNFGIFHCLFPFIPLTIWCAINLGPKIFFKYLLKYFIKTNYRAERLVFLDIFSRVRSNNK